MVLWYYGITWGNVVKIPHIGWGALKQCKSNGKGAKILADLTLIEEKLEQTFERWNELEALAEEIG